MDPQNTHEKKIPTQEYPRENFGPTKYRQEKSSDPRNTHETKILDPRINLREKILEPQNIHEGTVAQWH